MSTSQSPPMDPLRTKRPLKVDTFTPSDAAQDRPAKRQRIDSEFQEAINVYVGTDPELPPFGIGKERICQKSRFFAASCSPRWAKGKTGCRLPEEDEELFKSYLMWVRYDFVDLKTRSVSSDHDKRLRRCELLEWYSLADRKDDKALRNHVIGRLAGKAEMTAAVKDCAFVAAVYDQTASAESPMRKMLVDYFTAFGNSNDLKNEDYPASFVVDIAYRAVERGDVSLPFADVTKYYE